jgi:hypothetical protein
MQDPVPLGEFATKGVGPVTMRRRLNLTEDPRGCYVLLDRRRPVYVGISKHVIQRLMEHMRGTDHLTATLAYRIACAQHPHTLTAAEAMKDSDFCSQFAAVKVSMASWSGAFVEIENPLELYLFEAYCAMELDTGFEAVAGTRSRRTEHVSRRARPSSKSRLVTDGCDGSSGTVCRCDAESRRQNAGVKSHHSRYALAPVDVFHPSPLRSERH